MRKAAVIGAGKTGRGFIGRLLSESGCAVLFIDNNKELVDKLNREKSFKVHFFGNVRKAHTVCNFKAATWENADLSDIELILVSVGGSNLPEVGRALQKRINDGKKRYIITCENASHPAKTLDDAIGLSNVSIAESTVFCTTIEDGGLSIASENYPYLQYDAKPFAGYDPQIRGICAVADFGNFLTRKLYTYNAASCVIAYLGWIKGYTDYSAAANDPEILTLLDRNYAATNAVLCQAFGYDQKDQAEFAALSKQKFCDRTIADTVTRNAREPQRKLQHGERVIGPLVLLDQYGADTAVLQLTAAAMLLYENADEVQWRKIKEENTPAQILADIAGLPLDSKLSKAVLQKRERLERYQNGKCGSLLE